MDYKSLAVEICELNFEYSREMKSFQNKVSPRGEDAVLLWIARQEPPVYALDIIPCFDLSAGRVANILKQLEDKECITRTQDAEDMRRSQIMLTDKGRRVAAEKYEEMLSTNERLLSILGEKDGKEFIRIKQKLVKHLSEERNESK